MKQITLPNKTKVSAILDKPAGKKPIHAAITLAHGAGAGMTHEFMARLSQALVKEGFAVLRFQFPYMEERRGRPDSPAVATQTVAVAVDALASLLADKVDTSGKATSPTIPIFAAGKSFGARMSTTAASLGLLPQIRGLICFGFPLHPPKEADTKRAEHLAKIKIPTLFLQGTRDNLADLTLMRKVCKKLKLAQLHEVAEADHGFGVLKRSGRTVDEVIQELALETARFIQKKAGA